MLGVLCGLNQFSLGTHKTKKLPRSTVTVFIYTATTPPLCEVQATVATDTVFITPPTLGSGSWNQMNANCERTPQLGRGVRSVTFTLHSLPEVFISLPSQGSVTVPARLPEKEAT